MDSLIAYGPAIEQFAFVVALKSGMDLMDARQELYITVWQASLSYDPDKGDTKPYVYGALRNRSKRLIRTWYTYHKRVGSLEELPETRYTHFTDEVETSFLLDDFYETLPLNNNLRKVFNYLRQGYSQQEIGDMLGITRSGVSSIFCQIKNRAYHYWRYDE